MLFRLTNLNYVLMIGAAFSRGVRQGRKEAKKGVSGDILIDDDSISSARTSSTLGYRYIRRVIYINKSNVPIRGPHGLV